MGQFYQPVHPFQGEIGVGFIDPGKLHVVLRIMVIDKEWDQEKDGRE